MAAEGHARAVEPEDGTLPILNLSRTMGRAHPPTTRGVKGWDLQAAAERGRSFFRAHPLGCGIGFVLLVTALSMLLTMQGWKSRVPAFDLLTHMYNAREFIESGTLPQHGDTGSYGSYKPPGTAWLMMPSALLLDDPRLSEYIGTGCLHFATLLGIFLLAWRCFGAWAGYFAVLVYGLSTHGLFLAGSLWPNGRPDFYIWFVLLAVQWALRGDGRYLAAAAAVWGVGMHVDMAIAPAFFVLPFIWLAYRPPIRLTPLLIAGLVVVTVWSPYLRLEATREFADLRSQLLLQNIFPADYRRSWCNPTMTLIASDSASSTTEPGSSATQNTPGGGLRRLGRLSSSLTEAKAKILSNFTEAVTLPGVPTALLVLVLGSLLLCSVPASSSEIPAAVTRSAPGRHRRPRIALALIVLGIVGHGSISPAASVARRLPKLVFLSGLVLLTVPWLIATTQRVVARLGVQLQTTKLMRLLVISLVVPWFILVLVAELGKPERFWWLWPLQVIFLTASLTYLLPRFRMPRPVVAIGQLAVTLVLVVNPLLLWRVGSWRMDGWAGKESEDVQVIDYVASQIRGDGKATAAIGYQLYIYPFMAKYHITNPIYKVGAEFEFLLKYRHGIVNTDQCAEGVSPVDEYRIVQTRRKRGDAEPRHYFEVPSDDRFRLLRRFDLYAVYKRG